jgi:peptidyl-prolyl cis-trans isomerase C
MYRFARLSAAALLALGTAVLPALADEVTADTVLAEVNGHKITVGNLIEVRKTLPQQYQQLPDDVLFKGMLDQMIQQQVLADELGTPTRAEELTIQNQQAALAAGLMVKRILAQPISDEDLQKAYQAQYASAEPKKEYNASHILVKTKEEADDIIKQLSEGAKFADLARDKSQDPGSGAAGGELGWFSTGMMVKPFEDAVVNAKVGEVTGPIETQFGWHIILVNDTRLAEAPKLDDVRADLEKALRDQQVQDAIAAATAKAQIVRNDIPGLDPSIMKNEDLVK